MLYYTNQDQFRIPGRDTKADMGSLQNNNLMPGVPDKPAEALMPWHCSDLTVKSLI